MPIKKLRFLTDTDPWMLAEDIPDMDVFFGQIWQSCFVDEFVNPNGAKYKKLLSIHRGLHLWFYYGTEDSMAVGEHIAGRFVRHPEFAMLVNKKIILWADQLRRFAEKVAEDNLQKLSNRKLWQWYDRHDRVHTAYYQWCWIPVAADMFHDNLTNRLKQYLRTLVPEMKVNEYLVTLTQPESKSLIQQEQEEFLRIGKQVFQDRTQLKLFRGIYSTFQEQAAVPYGLKTHTPEYERVLAERVKDMQEKIKPAILRAVQAHYLKYFYVKFMWVGKDGVDTYDHYVTELVKLIGSGVDPVKKLRLMEREFTAQVQKKRVLMKRLRMSRQWQMVFTAWGDFMVTKIYRRFAQIYAVYRMQPILHEIAKRFNLTLTEVRLMLKNEVKQALLYGKVNKASLRVQTKFAVYYYEKGIEKVFIGSQARNLAKQAEKVVAHTATELHGQVACVGRGVGTVKIIIRPSDMAKMKQGDVLVSIATDPDIVPAMKKAVAIVTEQGGVTSHAAIVSRELKIPCVIGTKIATKVLKDGDRVEVDANQGIVRKI